MPLFRSFIVDKESFNIAVPIGLALQQRKNEAAGIILRNTNCNQRQKQVNWPKLVLEEIDPLWLESIKWVEKLFLASNLLASVPSNIHVLDKLCCLDLRRNQLKSIPSRLLQMPSLRDLRLSENKLTELPRNCKWSPSLKSVYLSDNSLETLPKSMATAKLTILYLARNNLYEVPQCIWKITTLQSLDLSGNPRLTQLPSQMGRLINIEMLRLENLEQVGGAHKMGIYWKRECLKFSAVFSCLFWVEECHVCISLIENFSLCVKFIPVNTLYGKGTPSEQHCFLDLFLVTSQTKRKKIRNVENPKQRTIHAQQAI